MGEEKGMIECQMPPINGTHTGTGDAARPRAAAPCESVREN